MAAKLTRREFLKLSTIALGAAIHSTYWHNDFGRPRSHGCLNCPPEAASWLFRWTMPHVDYIPGSATVAWPGGARIEIEGTPPPLASVEG